jgi:hypothetical protein
VPSASRAFVCGALIAAIGVLPIACGSSCRGTPSADAPKQADASTSMVDAAGIDKFGVQKIYPTIQGGREWYLPDDADHRSAEWDDKDAMVKTDEPGVFKVIGILNPRLDVHSPQGKAWWRNVEMTGYIRMIGVTEDAAMKMKPHWTFYARGERHTHEETEKTSRINDGVRAPEGTAVWPGYPFDAEYVNVRCLGTSMKGEFFTNGFIEWQKELSHPDGYTAGRPQLHTTFQPEPGQWFGMKVAIRNYDHDHAVNMQMWLDEKASGEWKLVAEGEDPGEGWFSKDLGINGCDKPPFNYRTDQAITWAGPFAAFRVDYIDYDFKWASVREVAPLP